MPLLLAHGISGRADLPISPTLARTAAAVVLLITFAVLATRWRAARFEQSADVLREREPVALSGRWFLVTQALGVIGLVLFLAVAFFGADDSAANPVPTWSYVWFWVGLVPLSVLLGPVWAYFNPARAISAVVRRLAGIREHAYPGRLGYWPAAASLLTFAWLELVKSRPDIPTTVGKYVVAYVVVHSALGVWFGSQWHQKGDGFEVFSRFFAYVSPRQRRDGEHVWVNPLRHLTAFPTDRGADAVVVVLLGSTAFDGLTRTQQWQKWAQSAQDHNATAWLGTAGLVAVIALVGLTYRIASALSWPSVAEPAARSTTVFARVMAHALMPVVVGYFVAHYFSLLLYQGQVGVLLAGDPFSRGWDLLGLNTAAVNYSLLSSSTISVIQVLAILGGHVVGVIAAHDRSLALFSDDQKRTGQYPLLGLMVVYTMCGIALLLGA